MDISSSSESSNSLETLLGKFFFVTQGKKTYSIPPAYIHMRIVCERNSTLVYLHELSK